MIPCAMQESGAVELYFYDELCDGERQAMAAHLVSCAECRAALDELTTIRAALAGRPVITAPAGGDWAPLMARIEAAVRAEQPQLMPFTAPPAVRRRPLPAYLAAAALFAFVTTSVAYLARHPVAPRPTLAMAGSTPLATARVEPPAAAQPAAARPAAIERSDPAFAAVSEQHFERSKLVILGLANRDPQTSSPADWAYERQLAGTLLDDTRLFKQAAEARGLGSLAGVMSDLELVLLQASLADQRDTATLDRLQRLIRRRDLVSKMEMVAF